MKGPKLCRSLRLALKQLMRPKDRVYPRNPKVEGFDVHEDEWQPEHGDWSVWIYLAEGYCLGPESTRYDPWNRDDPATIIHESTTKDALSEIGAIVSHEEEEALFQKQYRGRGIR